MCADEQASRGILIVVGAALGVQLITTVTSVKRPERVDSVYQVE
jgi:hypothetical protein